MKIYSVKEYQKEDKMIWDSFVNEAKNATFLFLRDFMEYHQDRFEDFSLLVFENNKLVALLPANRVEDSIFSHQGLTYGGLVYAESIKQANMIALFASVLQFLKENKFSILNIKSIPSIYHKKPAEELLYALFLVEAKLTRRDTLSVIDLNKDHVISKGRMEGVQKGIKKGLEVVEETTFESFWNEILLPNLALKHQAKPVHNLDEIQLLQALFPKNIRQFNVYYNGKIVAGTTIFESDHVAHAQYISGNEDKNELGSLDFLYYHLITKVFKNKRFLDFGVSNEEQGLKLNNGLSFWKESFGASTIVQDFYEVKTLNSHLLENVLL